MFGRCFVRVVPHVDLVLMCLWREGELHVLLFCHLDSISKSAERERKECGWDLHLCEGAVKEERLPHTGKSSHWQGQRGHFRASEESTATGVQRAKQRETRTEGWRQPALPSLRRLFTRLLGEVGAGY